MTNLSLYLTESADMYPSAAEPSGSFRSVATT
jgi:hypothetical protein